MPVSSSTLTNSLLTFPTPEAEATAVAAVHKVPCGYDPPPLDSYPAEAVLVVEKNQPSDVRTVVVRGEQTKITKTG